MTETFIKRVGKWGLLRRVAKPNKPWSFVNFASRLYDTEHEACVAAIELNVCGVERTHLPYLYKPVPVFLTVEIEEAIRHAEEQAS